MSAHLCPSMECAMSNHGKGWLTYGPPPGQVAQRQMQCCATHQRDGRGYQCKYLLGHDGDHCAHGTGKDIFWSPSGAEVSV